jgi:hypothetical protein
LELGSTKRIIAENGKPFFRGHAMSVGTAKGFQDYARDCVKLANGDNVPPELRKQLLEMAREWMQAVIEQEDGSEAPQSE